MAPCFSMRAQAAGHTLLTNAWRLLAVVHSHTRWSVAWMGKNRVLSTDTNVAAEDIPLRLSLGSPDTLVHQDIRLL